MQVTRPKSSKGRSRPKLSHAQSVDASVYNHSSVAPRPPSMSHVRADRCLRSRSLLRQSSVMSAHDEVPPALRDVYTPVFSLSRYKVLPSIEKKPAGDVSLRGMEEKTSKLSLSDNFLLQAHRCHREQHLDSIPTWAASQSYPEMGNVSEVLCRMSPKPPDPSAMAMEAEGLAAAAPDDQTGLLLAIRAPCGRRFEHHFHLTDRLQAVVAAAETTYETSYEDSLIVETMDPRSTFTDLTMTLAQCGILNRSVLYISED